MGIVKNISAIRRVRAKYKQVFGRTPQLLRPRRFTEKIQWRKLFDHDVRYPIFCDKLATREFIERSLGADHLVPLLWSGTPDAIPFDTLARPCVLKSTHASGHVVFILEGDDRDRDEITSTARGWMNVNYGTSSDEPGYRDVPPRVMVEALVTNDAGDAPLERRFFTFDGRVGFINTVFVEDGRIRNGAFHTRDWRQLDWYFTRKVERDFQRPESLDDMIAIAESLGRDLEHVRVDFFDCGKRFYVGELTLYSWSGFSKFNSDDADLALGALWRLKRPIRRAAFTTIFGRA